MEGGHIHAIHAGRSGHPCGTPRKMILRPRGWPVPDRGQFPVQFTVTPERNWCGRTPAATWRKIWPFTTLLFTTISVLEMQRDSCAEKLMLRYIKSDSSRFKLRMKDCMNGILGTYRLNWARISFWGWWDKWDIPPPPPQTQDSKFKPGWFVHHIIDRKHTSYNYRFTSVNTIMLCNLKSCVSWMVSTESTEYTTNIFTTIVPCFSYKFIDIFWTEMDFINSMGFIAQLDVNPL